MALGGRICPHCKRYTAKDEPRCIYCNQYLGPQWLTEITKLISANGLLATNVIAGLCLLMFVAETALSVATINPPPTADRFIFFGVPAETLIRLGALSHDDHEAWRLVASCFLHAGALHLLMNMGALYDYARILEPQIKWHRFFVAFVLTGIAGFWVSELWYSGSYYVTMGASGAVFGVQGLLLGDMLAKKDPRFREFLVRTIVYSTAFYFLLRTNQAAHMGGLAAGVVLGFVFGKESRPWYRDKYFKVAAAVCGIVIAVTIGFIVKNVMASG